MTTKQESGKTVVRRSESAAEKTAPPRARGRKFTAAHRAVLAKMLGRQSIGLIRSGLRYDMIEFIAQHYGLPAETLHGLIQLSDRTAARRKKDPLPLSPAQSERLVRVARSMAFATEVLEDSDNARRWLHTPNVALNDERPVDLLDTGIGYEQVMDVLRRIEFGVYS